MHFISAYLDHGSQPSVMSIIRRHEALSLTNRELRKRLGHAEEEVEQGNQQLESMKREHNVKKLVRHGLKLHKHPGVIALLYQLLMQVLHRVGVFVCVADGH